MYQVLFAEDELLVRLGLQNAIPWEKFDMELAAQADNGEEAFRLFMEIRPDVLITDIRMDKMDGSELIRRVREIDKDCAIIVISCLDDFWILKNLIPQRIIGYISKAEMSMEEIYAVLEDTRKYLKSLGREGRSGEPAAEPEALLAAYLQEGGRWPLEGEEPSELLLFWLNEKNREKINDLAMKFVRDLIRQQIPEGFLVEIGDREMCLLPDEPLEMDDIECVLRSIDGFLGVRFSVSDGFRKKGEGLPELYRRIKKEAGDEQENNYLVQSAIRHMRLHHQEPLSLTDISGVLGLSPSYFSHLFKKETGKAYVEYLNEIRLEAVKEDLRYSNDTIAVIAEKHGFNNQEYFSRLFKKCTGVSPARWRRQER